MSRFGETKVGNRNNRGWAVNVYVRGRASSDSFRLDRHEAGDEMGRIVCHGPHGVKFKVGSVLFPVSLARAYDSVGELSERAYRENGRAIESTVLEAGLKEVLEPYRGS